MRKTLTTFVATVCLLTLFVSSAACLDLSAASAMAASASSSITSHDVSTPEHDCCPAKNGSGMHTSISCCTVHHQSAIATAASLDISLDIAPASLPWIHLAGAANAAPYSGMTGSPLRRPATKLRI